MPAPAASALNKTLQSITFTKIRELEKQRTSYEAKKSKFLHDADATAEIHDRLAGLLQATRELCPGASQDPLLANAERWLQQSRYDSSIPDSMITQLDGRLRAKLEAESRKLALADLYARLLTEWLETDRSAPAEAQFMDEDNDGDEAFEVVIERQKQRLAELVDKFEATVFQPLNTNEDEIKAFLDKLFHVSSDNDDDNDDNDDDDDDDDDDDEEEEDADEEDGDHIKALKVLRHDMDTTSKEFLAERTPFTPESLTRCIRGLLTEDLLSDEKQLILRDFLNNDVALTEISDVLNMRFCDLANWDWDAGETGIRVLPRQQLNGKYRIWADDDILQLIFVQYIGIRLCNILKACLKDFIGRPGVWRWDQGYPTPTQKELERRQFYTGTQNVNNWKSVANERKSAFTESFFLCQLPGEESSLFARGAAYDDDNDSDGSDDASDKGKDDTPKSSIKQRLLRQLTSDLWIHRLRGVTHGDATDGDEQLGNSQGVAMVQTDLQWFATGLPHSTIYALMRYIGLSETWVDFFKKYLEAPLNLDAATEDRTAVGPRPRKRGVPMAHASEKFTGELVLFFLDFTVNARTGMLLYRLHDDIWLCGPPKTAATAWGCMQEYAKVFGLEFNQHKTGSVYLAGKGKRDAAVVKALPEGQVTMGFLKLNATNGLWEINQTLVKAHIDQLQKQLAGCQSVLSWVQTWNSCIGRFFSYTFGEPAHCFGRDHVDSILKTYQNMQRVLFSGQDGTGTSVVDHLRKMISTRFGMSVPDAFIFLPEGLGGLGLRNPFVGLFIVRNSIQDTPLGLIKKCLASERSEYAAQKKLFDNMPDGALRRRLKDIYPEGEAIGISAAEQSTFFPLEEYARFRETRSGGLCDTYTKFLAPPQKESVPLSREVDQGLAQFVGGIAATFAEPEKRWILQMYAEELLAMCGSLNLVDKQFLPVGILAMMRGKKVTWQMVL